MADNPLKIIASGSGETITFQYVNWRGVNCKYVVEPESVEYGHYGDFGSTGSIGEQNWVMHGFVVTRNDDPRKDMGTRRRTFLLAKMKNV